MASPAPTAPDQDPRDLLSLAVDVHTDLGKLATGLAHAGAAPEALAGLAKMTQEVAQIVKALGQGPTGPGPGAAQPGPQDAGPAQPQAAPQEAGPPQPAASGPQAAPQHAMHAAAHALHAAMIASGKARSGQ